ncbi:glycosyl transferase family 2 [Kribbella orskensis]|uniref:Glycosyl transferase family 2 n=1 Tax=Kribbella orskensis TaxID=2512216 RepID=A0ABY2BFJ5_9ACTN|nr:MULTISPECIES: glycosyltransferase family 2 protein [Kribbella]TCN37643.1 glycosyl transferase family 2 [Kribbella sp. VKM Ac-2500]TCO18855.1 glycosyl transferase family 2 [Kribbella orskensis]
MTGDRVSVVICAYTMARWQLLVEAVESVRQQTCPTDECIVVVDHSGELLDRAKNELGPDVRVIANESTRGLSGARNIGVAAASGDVVAFLDDDAAAEPAWLERLTVHYADRSVIGVGGLVVPEWATGRPWWFPAEFGWVVGCSYTGLPVTTAQVRNPIGANMSFRREPVLMVGGFATSVGRLGADGLGCEETELSIRLARRFPGMRILHEPAAVVHHHVPADRARWTYFRRRCWAEGISKAEVSRLAGPRLALATERTYALRTVPRGAANDLAAALRVRAPRRMARAAVSLAGLTLTATGYLTRRVRTRAVPPTTTTGKS